MGGNTQKGVPLCKRADVGVEGKIWEIRARAELTNKIKVNRVINLFVPAASILFTFQEMRFTKNGAPPVNMKCSNVGYRVQTREDRRGEEHPRLAQMRCKNCAARKPEMK